MRLRLNAQSYGEFDFDRAIVIWIGLSAKGRCATQPNSPQIQTTENEIQLIEENAQAIDKVEMQAESFEDFDFEY
jgi:hypothetical protein